MSDGVTNWVRMPMANWTALMPMRSVCICGSALHAQLTPWAKSR